VNTLDKIKQWIKIHSPAVLEQLEDPASNKDIQIVESAIGIKLPGEFKTLLQTHNGEQGSFETLLGDGNALLSCAGILEAYNLERKHCEISHTDLLQKQEWKELALEDLISVSGAVHPHESHEKWIPITSMNGDVLRYIDYDPAPSGDQGQIIEVDFQSGSWKVIAPSFEALLEQYFQDLTNGQYTVDEHGDITKIDQNTENLNSSEVPSWLQAVDDTREFHYAYNDEDWHLDLRNDPVVRAFLEKTYPMELEIFAWQDYQLSKIDSDYYDITWTGTPAGMFIAFAHASIFGEIASKIKKRSQQFTSIRLKVSLLKHDDPADKKAHPKLRCWLEVTDAVLVE